MLIEEYPASTNHLKAEAAVTAEQPQQFKNVAIALFILTVFWKSHYANSQYYLFWQKTHRLMSAGFYQLLSTIMLVTYVC